MKMMMLFILWMSAVQMNAQSYLNSIGFVSKSDVDREQREAQARAALINKPVADPNRFFGKQNVVAGGGGWVVFSGRVVAVRTNGVTINGVWYNPQLKLLYSGDFFLVRFPYSLGNGDEIIKESKYAALPSGMISLDENHRLRCLDYGLLPGAVVKTKEEIAAEKAKVKSTALATLKYNREQADAGDAFNQLRMGERYRDGDGVAKDLPKAREMFAKSAAQGNKEASEALKTLPAK